MNAATFLHDQLIEVEQAVSYFAGSGVVGQTGDMKVSGIAQGVGAVRDTTNGSVDHRVTVPTRYLYGYVTDYDPNPLKPLGELEQVGHMLGARQVVVANLDGLIRTCQLGKRKVFGEVHYPCPLVMVYQMTVPASKIVPAKLPIR